jgi:hypothetical protein
MALCSLSTCLIIFSTMGMILQPSREASPDIAMRRVDGLHMREIGRRDEQLVMVKPFGTLWPRDRRSASGKALVILGDGTIGSGAGTMKS